MTIGAWADWIAVSAAVLFYLSLFASGMVAAARGAPADARGHR